MVLSESDGRKTPGVISDAISPTREAPHALNRGARVLFPGHVAFPPLPGAHDRICRAVPSLPSREPPGGSDWLHEVKFDGYRAMIRRDGANARLFTRRGYDWTERERGALDPGPVVPHRWRGGLL